MNRLGTLNWSTQIEESQDHTNGLRGRVYCSESLLFQEVSEHSKAFWVEESFCWLDAGEPVKYLAKQLPKNNRKFELWTE